MHSFCKIICAFAGFILPMSLFSQTISTGSIVGSPFCPGATINISYTVTGSFNSGNVFTAELSDASGNFSTPVSIGTVASIAAGSITATLPFAQTTGILYRIRVVAGDPMITGSDNGTDLTVATAASPGFDHTKTWIGGTGIWSNPSNWSPCGLPNGASNIEIGSGAEVTLATGAVASILSMQVKAGGKLKVDAGATLNINGSTNIGLQLTDASTSVTNNGAINLGNFLAITSGGIGLFTGSTFVNNTGASVVINDIIGTASNGGYGISISASNFTNSGMVQIGNNKAISRYGLLFFTGQINNQSSGVIEINRITAFDGLAGNGTGTINNAGSIKVGNLAAVKQTGINIAAGIQLINQSTGMIEIDNITTGDAFSGAASNTTITNSGTFKVGNHSAVNRSGISLFSNCVFNNNAGAFIEIDQVKSTATNEGRGLALNTSSLFSNAGSLKIGNTLAIYRSAIFAGSGKFINQNTGLVELNRTSFLDAITGNGTGSVTNAGSIKIGNVAGLGQSGINMNNGFQFTNQAGALIEVNNIANSPAIFTNGPGSLITNAGVIKIGNQTMLSYGLLLIGGGKLMNESSAIIEIDNATGAGSSCLGIIGTGSRFTNGGLVAIGKNAPLNLRGIEMDALATFTNQPTGTVEVISSTANQVNFSAVFLAGVNTLFDNAGLMKIQLKAPVSVNHGLVLNGNSIFNSQAGSRLELNIFQ